MHTKYSLSVCKSRNWCAICILKVSQFVRQTTKFEDRKVVFVKSEAAAIFLLLLPLVRFYVKTNAREEAGVSDRYGML